MSEEYLRDAAKVVDSRENLEADVYRAADEMDRFYCGEKFINTHKIIRWLDRQAAITRREVLCSPDERDEQMAELQAKVDELTAERDALRIYRDSWERKATVLEGDVDRLVRERDGLTAELAKRDKGIARLKRRRDELERALEIDGRIKVSQDAAIEEIAKQRDEAYAELEKARQGQGERGHGPIDGEPDSAPENVDCGRESGFEWLVSQIEWYADECARLERLNAELRDKLSEAIGHAVDILHLQDLSAVDMEGEVVA